jgi:hypothetical protein
MAGGGSDIEEDEMRIVGREETETQVRMSELAHYLVCILDQLGDWTTLRAMRVSHRVSAL